MSEFWIVSPEGPEEHESFEAAERVREALQRHVPAKVFKVYRCKRWLKPAEHFPKMVALLRDIVEGGLTPDALARARILLLTIGNRNRPKQTMTVNRSVPEFDARRNGRT